MKEPIIVHPPMLLLQQLQLKAETVPAHASDGQSVKHNEDATYEIWLPAHAPDKTWSVHKAL